MTGLNKNVNWNAIWNTLPLITEEAEKSEIKKMQNEGYKFMVGNQPMYDECGFAIVKWKDKRSGLYRSYKKFLEINFDEDADDIFSLYPSSSRQEKRVNVAVAKSVADYLNLSFGDCVYVKSWTD